MHSEGQESSYRWSFASIRCRRRGLHVAYCHGRWNMNHSQPESTQQSTEWRHTSPWKKTFKSARPKKKSFGNIKKFLWTCYLAIQQWFYHCIETLRIPHALLWLSSSSCRKNFRSMAPPWQLLTTHKCANRFDRHKFRMDSIFAPCLQFWSRIMRI